MGTTCDTQDSSSLAQIFTKSFFKKVRSMTYSILKDVWNVSEFIQKLSIEINGNVEI